MVDIEGLPASMHSLSEKWLAEQWLMAAGVVPETAIDTLLMYAYAQKGVEKVKIEIDKDDSNNGEHPKVTYLITLEKVSKIKWEAAEALKNKIKHPLIQKTALLALAKLDAPIDVEKRIVVLAQEYLPKKYTIEVKIVD